MLGAMNLATSLDIIASCLGLFSAVFFSIGILHFKSGRAEEVATKMWGRGLAAAEDMLSQKADFIVGSFLLVLSFSVQFALKAFPSIFEQSVVENQIQGVAISVAIATAIAIASRIANHHLGKVFLRQLQESTAGKL